jgi:protein-disulfide isomerase
MMLAALPAFPYNRGIVEVHVKDVPMADNTPVSLRDTAPDNAPGPAERGGSQIILLSVTAVVFLLVGVFLAVLFGGGDDSMSDDELRDTVVEVVGTEIAARGSPAPAQGENVDPASLQAMIDSAVGTQVATLIPTTTPIPPTPTRIPLPASSDDDAFLGPEDAPVVIVEFSDFQCGFCGRWYDETLPQILEKYPDEVKFVYRDFPIFGEDSARAAMATECAADQDKFWDMHDRIFELQMASELALDQASLVSMAADLDMDAGEFEQCLASEKYLDEVLLDFQAADMYGFRGTPGFIINGAVYTFGAQPFEVFDSIIQSELSGAG